MKRILLYMMITVLPVLFATGQAGRLYFEPDNNFRLHPGNVSQTEVFIVNSPLDPGIMFASCNTLTFIPFFVSEGIYVSTDGGGTWQGSDTCSGEPFAFHGGDPGIAIDKDGTLILTRLGRAPFSGLYSHYSTDNGLSWSAQKVISTDDLERASLATDYFPGSPFYGRTYAIWVRFSPPFPLMMSYTDDGGQAWSIPVPINDPPNRSAGGDICVGPGGEVYVCWAGVTDVTPFKEIYVGFASSGNGGSSWTVSEEAFAMNGITGLLPEKGNIRVNGLPGIAVDTSAGDYYGWIYIVTGQKDLAPAGSDPDIILNRSEDGGQSWSPAIRVNQDITGNGKIQYFPAVHVDMYGAVDIIFYDDRNTGSDSAGVWLARSADGGDSWKEYEISDHNYRPEPIGGLGQGYQGDNIDITSTPDKLWPVWMDNSTGIYQLWSVPINFSSLDRIPGYEKPHARLLQNRPNPFTGSTTISFFLNEPGFVSLKVFSMSGSEIFTPSEGYFPAGMHEVDVAIRHAGIYIYSLDAGGYRVSRKMVSLP